MIAQNLPDFEPVLGSAIFKSPSNCVIMYFETLQQGNKILVGLLKKSHQFTIFPQKYTSRGML